MPTKVVFDLGAGAADAMKKLSDVAMQSGHSLTELTNAAAMLGLSVPASSEYPKTGHGKTIHVKAPYQQKAAEPKPEAVLIGPTHRKIRLPEE